MSNFAEINSDNIVIRVLACDNNDPAGDEGYQWLIDNLGGTWIKTSYNGSIRKNFAGIGYEYRKDIDAFVAPQPFPSWILDSDAQWQSPTPFPADGKNYGWDEPSRSWIES
jgi:hypothetical protein